MYRFLSENRDYSLWNVTDSTTKNKVDLGDIQPIKNKLFNLDIFSYDGDKITIHSSQIRDTVIPGVLVLEDTKTFGKRKKKFLYKCIPNDIRLPIFLVPYSIKHTFHKSYKNIYVTIYFKNWDMKHPEGYIDQNIGSVDDIHSFCTYQLYCRNLNISNNKFTKDTLKKLQDKPESELIHTIIKRYNVIDRRKLHVVTIDPIDSKDFDDAIGLQNIAEGYILSIYIANVPLWLDYLELWTSFTDRVATIYLPHRKIPMLPAILSDVLCSLQEHCSRFAVALDVYLDHEYRITDYKILNTVICVKNNLRYDTESMEHNTIYQDVYKIVERLNKNKMYIDHIKSSHDVIAYLMILMNHYCATVMFDHNIGIYRSMTTYKTSIITTNENINQFLKGWNSTGGHYCKIADSAPHDALEVDRYIHITSPIRRLVDLLNIMEIQTALNITTFTKAAESFHHSKITDDQIIFINTTMRSIRKVQNDCNLLHLCRVESDILSKKHKGFVFDKIKKEDDIFQYQIYLVDLKIVKKIYTSLDIKNGEFYNVQLYLFMDQTQLYNKIKMKLCV